MGGWGPRAQALFVWTPQRPDGEQMWEGRRPGSQPEQLGEIKNNSIPGDMGNYSGRERARDVRSERQRESFRAMWSLERVSVDYERLYRQGDLRGLLCRGSLKLIHCSCISSGSTSSHAQTQRYACSQQ